MHIAKGPRRTALKLATLRPEVRNYIGDLERELERTQRRNCRLRQNIRSMQGKLEVKNLRDALGLALVGMTQGLRKAG